jgi:hypothetical protein
MAPATPGEDVSRLTRDASASEVLRMEPDGIVEPIRPRTADKDGVKTPSASKHGASVPQFSVGTASRFSGERLVQRTNNKARRFPSPCCLQRSCSSAESCFYLPRRSWSARGRAAFTVRVRSPSVVPWSPVMAFCVSSSLAISTKPKPLLRPVSRSVTM